MQLTWNEPTEINEKDSLTITTSTKVVNEDADINDVVKVLDKYESNEIKITIKIK